MNPIKRITARITTISPVYYGGEKMGNIGLPMMIHATNDQKNFTIKRELLETLIKAIGAFYRDCDKSSFGHRSFSEAFQDRVYVAACSQNVTQFFDTLRRHLPVASETVYQYITKFAFSLTQDDSRSLLQYVRQYISMMTAVAIYQTESYQFKQDFQISDDMCQITMDYLIPTLPGNGFRGKMRDEMISQVAAVVYDNPDPNQVWSPRIYHTLRSGGMLTQATGFVNIEAKAELRKKLPFLSILGCMKGNEDLPGKIDVNFARLHCWENYPEEYERSGMSFLREYFITRNDNYEGAVNEEWLKEIGSNSVQMITFVLAIQPGAEFDWSVDHYYLTESEKAFLDLGLWLLKTKGKIGGKAAAGLGHIDIQYLDGYDPQPDRALAYLAENKQEIKETIETVLT